MAAQNIDDVYTYIKDKFINLFKDDISDYELNMIRSSLQLAYRDIPTSKSILGDRISEATKMKSDIYYIMTRLKDKRKIISINYNSKYNKLYTVLTRQGRPSKQAIESEIFYLNADMFETRNVLNDYDELLEFLNNQLSIIDMIIRNMENRRYDLWRN